MKRWYFYPLAVIYNLITGIRNLLYSLGIFRSTRFKIPIVNIGNLSVGGTGKSPMVMYVADLISKHYRTGVLSRGYGRMTKGYQITNYDSNYKIVGDEAMQLFERFRNRFVIAVCENRVKGARKLIKDMGLESLILDDAYQHRAIKAGLNILMTEYHDPYFKDYLLPAGNLRESRLSDARADIIVVSKCPNDLTEEKKKYFLSKIKPNKKQRVFFSSIKYSEKLISKFESLPDNALSYYEVLLVTGIANPTPLLEHLKKFTQKIKHLKYKDHHNFTEKDFNEIMKEYKKMGEYKIILTTEKDFVRLRAFDFMKNNAYYLPIKTEIDEKEYFNEIILNYVTKFQRNR